MALAVVAVVAVRASVDAGAGFADGGNGCGEFAGGGCGVEGVIVVAGACCHS